MKESKSEIEDEEEYDSLRITHIHRDFRSNESDRG